MKKLDKKFLVKVENTENWTLPKLIGKYETLEEAKAKVNEYEKRIDTQRYKREFCIFEEQDGIHKGYCITIF